MFQLLKGCELLFPSGVRLAMLLNEFSILQCSTFITGKFLIGVYVLFRFSWTLSDTDTMLDLKVTLFHPSLDRLTYSISSPRIFSYSLPAHTPAFSSQILDWLVKNRTKRRSPFAEPSNTSLPKAFWRWITRNWDTTVCRRIAGVRVLFSSSCSREDISSQSQHSGMC